MAPAFSFSNVSHTYSNGTKALEDFSLSVKQSERVSLIGPSGCGKSTALRLLAKFDQASSGQISNQSSSLGYVFQDATLLPWANVFDNVYLPFKVKGIPRSEVRDKIEQMLDTMGLLEFATAWPRELSGGMKMRVSIARALISKPELLLLDEPFAALDEITRFLLNDLLLELQNRDQFTLLFVTHSVFESVYLSNRIAVMSQRPGGVASMISTPNGRLTGDAYRASRQYTKSCAEVSGALRQAMKSDLPDLSE